MTRNQKRKYILLPLLIIGVLALITLAVLRGFYGIEFGTWQYFIVPIWIGFVGVAYLNYKDPAKKSQ